MFDPFKVWILAACFALLLCGCATTKLDTHVSGDAPPLFQGGDLQGKLIVLWGTAWRKNQKEGERREDIAFQAISEFFNEPGKDVVVQKTVDGKSAVTLSDFQIVQSDEVKKGEFRKIIVLRLEELGPTLSFYLSPILWQGSTDIFFRVRVLDPANISLGSDVSVHWVKGGPFVLRGTSTLKEDLKSALSTIFEKAR
jgi:hypothetical protein